MKPRWYKKGPVAQRAMPFWCLMNPLGDPFGRGILPQMDSLDAAKMIAAAGEAGLIELTAAHDDDLVPWDPSNPFDDLDMSGPVHARIMAIHEVLYKARVGFHTITCSLHGPMEFANGGLANPDPKKRELALLKVKRCLRIGAKLGATSFTYWVARDGFEVVCQVSGKVMQWLVDGLNAVTDYITEMKFTNYLGATIEPKPNEPRAHMYLPTAGHAVGIIAALKKSSFWGVNPELLQHEGMAGLSATGTVAYLVGLGKLSFLHLGGQVKCQFDDDFPPMCGPEGMKEMVGMFSLLQRMHWKGIVEFDCHAFRPDGDSSSPDQCRWDFIVLCSEALSLALVLARRVWSIKPTTTNNGRADLSWMKRMCAVSDKTVNRLMIVGEPDSPPASEPEDGHDDGHDRPEAPAGEPVPAKP